MIYDASTELSELMILDAESLADELAVVPLKNHIPMVFIVVLRRYRPD